jgi:hypothetical protein
MIMTIPKFSSFTPKPPHVECQKYDDMRYDVSHSSWKKQHFWVDVVRGYASFVGDRLVLSLNLAVEHA